MSGVFVASKEDFYISVYTHVPGVGKTDTRIELDSRVVPDGLDASKVTAAVNRHINSLAKEIGAEVS